MVAHQAAGLGGDLLELQNDVSLDILAHHPVGQRQQSFEKRRQRERTVVRRDQQVIRSRDLLDRLELPFDAHRRCAGVERPTCGIAERRQLHCHGLNQMQVQPDVSWTDWARTVAAHALLNRSLIYEADAHELAWRGIRPGYSALGTERRQQMPDFEESLARCVASWQTQLT